MTSIQNMTSFLSDGVPPSLKSLEFIFNDDYKLYLAIAEENDKARSILNSFSHLFINNTIPSTVNIVFKILHVRRNHIPLRTELLRNTFKIPSLPRTIAYGIGDEGKWYSL